MLRLLAPRKFSGKMQGNKTERKSQKKKKSKNK